MLAAGATSSMVLLFNGACMAWGADSSGQLGLGGSVIQSFPSSIESLVYLEIIKAVSLSESHSLFLDASGLRATGCNKSGVCGIQGPSLAPSPSKSLVDFGSKKDKVCLPG
jgi:alpha-tubulin suppressor-like RCC1 family protein